MKKLKEINWSSFVTILKACLLGIVFTLVGVLVFAVILKFTNLPTKFISFINDIIKILSLFVIILIINKKMEGKLLIKAVVAGVIYSLLTLIIFSALNGGISFNVSIIYDLLFAVISSVIITVIVGLISRKTT